MKDIVLLSLAVYRLTTLLNKDIGPFEIFLRFREWSGIETKLAVEIDEYGITHEFEKRYPEGQLAEIVDCPYCLSGYIAIFVLLTSFPYKGRGLKLTLKIFKPFYLWLGIWGLVDLLITFTNDKR